MAASAAFGVLFATVITLVLLSILILISHDFRRRFGHSVSDWKALPQGAGFSKTGASPSSKT